MSDAINNDRPAFPCLDSTESGLHLREPGLSMRDYFAAKAMQSLILRGDNGLCDTAGCYGDNTTGTDEPAISAYLYADAMLRARDTK